MKYCKNCKKEYPETKNFCEDCGGKLSKFIEHSETPKKPNIEEKQKEISHKREIKQDISKNNRNIIIVAGGVIILIFFMFYISGGGVVSSSTGSSSSNQLSSNTCRDVQEAYQEQEAYQTPLSYSVLSSSLKEEWDLQKGYYYRYDITVSNSDDNGGQFTVNFVLQTSKHGTLSDSSTQYVSSHSTQIFEKIFDTDMGEQVSGTHSVVPPTKTEYRTVTKYRTVRKCD